MLENIPQFITLGATTVARRGARWYVGVDLTETQLPHGTHPTCGGLNERRVFMAEFQVYTQSSNQTVKQINR